MSEKNTYISYLCNCCGQLCSYFYTCNDDNCFNSIMVYSNITNNVNNCINKLYHSSECMESTCNIFTYSFKYLICLLTNKSIEPMKSNWMRISSVICIDNKYKYNCKYHYLDDLKNDFQSKSSLYNFNKFKFKKYAKYLSDELHENNDFIFSKPWYTMKILFSNNNDIENIIISRLWSLNYDFPDFIKSSVRFLTIEYEHPELNEYIPLEIDISWYIVGNELFSCAMLLHLLQHQEEQFKFDSRYKLHIMDNNINMHQLKCNEYILLEKNEMKICETYI